MARVNILMATFNGQRYIRQQIASIQAQTYEDWILHISDDGSTDGTIDIIKEISKDDVRIKIKSIRSNDKNLGAALSFMDLLCSVDEGYVALSDQDDIWFENKLEILLDRMKRLESGSIQKPRLIFGMGYHFYEGINRINGLTNLGTPCNLKDFLFLNGGIQGCSMLLNHALVVQLKRRPPSAIVMHDHHITLMALTFGSVDKVCVPLMLYRHHSNNVSFSKGGGRFNKILLHLFSVKYLLEKHHYDATRLFFLENSGFMSNFQKEIFRSYMDTPQKKVGHRIWDALKYKFTIHGSVLLYVYRAIFFGNIFSDSRARLFKMTRSK